MCWNDLAKKAWASNMTHGSHKWQHLKHHFASNFGQHIVESWDLTITRAGAQWGLKPGGPAAARLLINQLSPPAEIWRSPHRVLPIGRLLPDLGSNHLSCLHLWLFQIPKPHTATTWSQDVAGSRVIDSCCWLQRASAAFVGRWEAWTRSPEAQGNQLKPTWVLGVDNKYLKHPWQIGGEWKLKRNKGEADGRAVGLGQGLQKVIGGTKTSKHFSI